MMRVGLSDWRGRGTGHDKGGHDGFAEISFFILRGGGMGRETGVVWLLRAELPGSSGV